MSCKFVCIDPAPIRTSNPKQNALKKLGNKWKTHLYIAFLLVRPLSTFSLLFERYEKMSPKFPLYTCTGSNDTGSKFPTLKRNGKLANDRLRKYLILCQIKTTSIEMWSMAMNGQWHVLGFRKVDLSTLKRVVLPTHIESERKQIEFTWMSSICAI